MEDILRVLEQELDVVTWPLWQSASRVLAVRCHETR